MGGYKELSNFPVGVFDQPVVHCGLFRHCGSLFLLFGIGYRLGEDAVAILIRIHLPALHQSLEAELADLLVLHQVLRHHIQLVPMGLQNGAGTVVGLLDDAADFLIDLGGHRLGVIGRAVDIHSRNTSP